MEDEAIIDRIIDAMVAMRRPGRAAQGASEIDRRRYRGEARRTLARLRALPKQGALR